MRVSKQKTEEIQLDRVLFYPEDRICFMRCSEEAAMADKGDIERFRKREISFATLKECIANNNRLPAGSITDNALERFLISIGEMREI